MHTYMIHACMHSYMNTHDTYIYTIYYLLVSVSFTHESRIVQ